VRRGVRRFTHRSYSNKNPLRSAGDCSSGKPCLKLILAFQITTQLSNGGSTQDKHGLQKTAAVARWHNESPARPSAAYIHGGRSCLVLMGNSYNPNLDKKYLRLARRHYVFPAKTTIMNRWWGSHAPSFLAPGSTDSGDLFCPCYYFHIFTKLCCLAPCIGQPRRG